MYISHIRWLNSNTWLLSLSIQPARLRCLTYYSYSYFEENIQVCIMGKSLNVSYDGNGESLVDVIFFFFTLNGEEKSTSFVSFRPRAIRGMLAVSL